MPNGRRDPIPMSIPGTRRGFKIMSMTMKSKTPPSRRHLAVMHRLRDLGSKIHFPYICILWYLFGLLIFHTYAQWHMDRWTIGYYWWESMVNVLMLLAFFNPKPINWHVFWPVLVYAIVRQCIFLIILVAKMDINGRPIVTTLYLFSLSASIFLTIKENRRWNRASGSQ